MANYYTKVSFMVKMTEEQFLWLSELHNANSARMDNWIEDEDRVPVVQGDAIKAAYEAMMEFEDSTGVDTLEYQDKDQAAWFYSENADADYMAHLVHQFLRHFDINEPVTFEWANDCSRPRTDAYGGGGFVITKNAVFGMSTSTWCYETIKRLSGEVVEPDQQVRRTRFLPKDGGPEWMATLSGNLASGYDVSLFLDLAKRSTADSGWMLELGINADGSVCGQITAHPGYDGLAAFTCTHDTLKISGLSAGDPAYTITVAEATPD